MCGLGQPLPPEVLLQPEPQGPGLDLGLVGPPVRQATPEGVVSLAARAQLVPDVVLPAAALAGAGHRGPPAALLTQDVEARVHQHTPCMCRASQARPSRR